MKMNAMIVGLLLSSVTLTAGETLPDWNKNLRPDHPRLFLNQDIVKTIRTQAGGAKHDAYRQLCAAVDKADKAPKLKFKEKRFTLQPDGRVKFVPPAYLGGDLVYGNGSREASSAALLYLINGEPQYRDKGIQYLKMAVEYLSWCLHHQVAADWHSDVALNTLAAYDWLYNALSPAERKSLGEALLEYVKEIQPGGKARYVRAQGGPDTGHYGSTSLLWPTGIVFAGAGINDRLAAEFLVKGYGNFCEVMNYRDKISHGTGLLVALAASYSFVAYPWSSFFFYHSGRAAFGQDFSQQYAHMKDYINWFVWASIPLPHHAGFLHYGIGDTEHTNNQMELGHMYAHMAQLIHFYGQDYPQVEAQARAVIDLLPPAQQKFVDWYPFMPLLLTGFQAEGKVAQAPIDAILKGRKSYYFPSFGLAIMRSGYTPESTFAVFRTGSQYTQHQHYDENHFTIYKYGFQALDTGNRTQTLHHTYYYPQTVAHNAILIDLPDEPMPVFWKAWGPTAEPVKPNQPVYCDGGQNNRVQGKCLHYETNSQYTYVVGDATASYDARKCRQSIREFLFIYPDYFVIFDRVESVTASQTKRWLLHTAHQPEKVGDYFYKAENGGGALYVQNLSPEKTETVLIGGPTQRFFTNGRNWPVTNEAKIYAKPNVVMGEWRLEEKASTPAKRTDFLHLLTVGRKDAAPVAGQGINTANEVGVEFVSREGTQWRVFFNRAAPGGKIIARRDGKVTLEQNMAIDNEKINSGSSNAK